MKGKGVDNMTTFKVGQTYKPSDRVGWHDRSDYITVVSRTAKYVTFTGDGDTFRLKVHVMANGADESNDFEYVIDSRRPFKVTYKSIDVVK